MKDLEQLLIDFLKYVQNVHVDSYGHLEICETGDELDPTYEKVVKSYLKTKQNMEINTGTIVKYETGFYRVTRCTKNTVNLGSVFGSTIYHKGIKKSEVTEAHDEWYEKWTQSESYKCM